MELDGVVELGYTIFFNSTITYFQYILELQSIGKAYTYSAKHLRRCATSAMRRCYNTFAARPCSSSCKDMKFEIVKNAPKSPSSMVQYS